MVETLINVPTGAPSAPDSTRLRDVARSHAALPRVQTSAFSTQQDAPASTSSTVAPDILIAAQQARDTARPPAFDTSLVYVFSQSRQQSENKRQAEPSPQNDGGAQIIPLRANAARDALQSESSPFYARTTTPSPSATSENGPLPGGGSAEFIRANQAYVRAGAADGIRFAVSGLDTSAFPPYQSAFDLLV